VTFHFFGRQNQPLIAVVDDEQLLVMFSLSTKLLERPFKQISAVNRGDDDA
jgi:hypothetical protein